MPNDARINLRPPLPPGVRRRADAELTYPLPPGVRTRGDVELTYRGAVASDAA